MIETRYRRSENFVFRKIVNEMILVPVKGNIVEMEHIFTLNEVGAFIWDELAQPRTLDELESVVLENFDAEPEIVRPELEAFLADLAANQALERTG
jgi:hypothetical protein